MSNRIMESQIEVTNELNTIEVLVKKNNNYYMINDYATKRLDNIEILIKKSVKNYMICDFVNGGK